MLNLIYVPGILLGGVTTSFNLLNKFVSAIIRILEIEIRRLPKIKQLIQIYTTMVS